MRLHPISPVTEPMQYRAIGVVQGHYVATDPEHDTRGLIRTDDGTELEAVLLGRVLSLVRRRLNPDKPHLWVVYPRCRDTGTLHLQIVGVWEPSTLLAAEAEAASANSPADPATDALPEGDGYFSVRGELVFTRPESGELVVKVRQQARGEEARPQPFKLQLLGEIPLEHLRHFVALQLRRDGQALRVESFEVIGPVAQRGTRGGKARGTGRDGAGRGAPRSGGRRAGAPVGSSAAGAPSTGTAPGTPARDPQRTAIRRPGA
jgi:hypothetical protein